MGKYDDYKKKIVTHAKWLSGHGYFGAIMGSGGNVSMRIKGENAIAVTPSGMSYADLSEGDICILDFEKTMIDGKKPPSIESGMHIAIYKHRLDVNAVVHTHQKEASVFSIIHRPIPALFDETCLHLGEIVDVVSYAFSGTPELVKNVESKLSNGCHAYLLQNHGVLCLGMSVEQACLNAELLEKTASIYSRALSTGLEVTLLPEDMAELLKAIRKETQKKNAQENELLLKC